MSPTAPTAVPRHDQHAAASPPAPVVQARALGLTGPRGSVYSGVDLTVPAGTLAVVAGPAGSGRTSLLLTLAGRMRPTTGALFVAGHALPRHVGAVQRVSGLAEIDGVTTLEPRMTAAEHVRERLALAGPWWHLGHTRRTAERTRRALAAVTSLDPAMEGRDAGDGVPLPDDVPVADLPAPARWRLGLALALVEGPRLVVVDDLDTALPHGEDVAAAWRLLRAVADTGVTVVAACTDPARIPDGVADQVTSLGPGTPSTPTPTVTR